MTNQSLSHNGNPELQDEPIVEVSLEEMNQADAELRREMEASGVVDTAHTDGSTSNPVDAQKQGLSYTPPSDPPVLPSDDPQGVEIAAGFASSMEATNPNVRDLPDRVDNNDLDLEQDIQVSLRMNSETNHLSDVQATVEDGIVELRGTVFARDDIALVQRIVKELPGVVDVRNDLHVAPDRTSA